MEVIFMGKKLFKKLLSGTAASMMMFGAAPKSNTKAVRHSSSVGISIETKNDVVATCVAGVALAAVAVGAGVVCHLQNKAWKEEVNRREGLISSANVYIKDLASSLKEVIPRSNGDLFNSLVNCRNYVDLRNWQNQVYNCNNLNSSTLDKIINCLYDHWRTNLEKIGYYSNDAAHYADVEIWKLRDKYNRLVEKERWDEHMKLEKEKLKKIEDINQQIRHYPPNTGFSGSRNNIVINYGNNYY
jgi:hypothetical protein